MDSELPSFLVWSLCIKCLVHHEVYSVSWSCLLSFLCNPYIPFQIYEIFYLLVTIAVRSEIVSGVILQQCSEILIQLFKIDGYSDRQRNKHVRLGFLYMKAHLLSLQVSNISYGVILFNTSNSYITDTATMNHR